MYDYATKIDITYLNGVGVKKGESVSLSIILRKGMKMVEYFKVFNYRPPIPEIGINTKDRNIIRSWG